MHKTIRKDSISLIHESVQAEGRVLDVLIKNGCSNEDYEKVSTMLTRIYLCGFEVGRRCVVK